MDVASLRTRLLELATDNARLRERVEELEVECEERGERDSGEAEEELVELKAEFEQRHVGQGQLVALSPELPAQAGNG